MAHITIVCNNYKEMMDFARQLVGNGQSPVDKEKKIPDSEPYGRQIAKDFPDANTKAEDTKAEDTTSKETEASEPEEKTMTEAYTLVDVRAKLAALNKAGKKEKVQALIRSFGVEKLSQIGEEHYAQLMEKAGEL